MFCSFEGMGVMGVDGRDQGIFIGGILYSPGTTTSISTRGLPDQRTYMENLFARREAYFSASEHHNKVGTTGTRSVRLFAEQGHSSQPWREIKVERKALNLDLLVSFSPPVDRQPLALLAGIRHGMGRRIDVS